MTDLRAVLARLFPKRRYPCRVRVAITDVPMTIPIPSGYTCILEAIAVKDSETVVTYRFEKP